MKTIAMFLVMLGLCLDAQADVIAIMQATGGETHFTDEKSSMCNDGWLLAVFLENNGSYQAGCWKWMESLQRVSTEYENGNKFLYDPSKPSFRMTDYGINAYGGK